MTNSNYQLPEFIKNCKGDLLCTEVDKSKINIAIMTLKALGVPFHEDTNEYDDEYKMLVFEKTSWMIQQMTQTYRQPNANRDTLVDSIEKFIGLFLGVHTEEVVEGITDSYNAIVTTDNKIKVGCQTVNIEAFKKLVDVAKVRGII